MSAPFNDQGQSSAVGGLNWQLRYSQQASFSGHDWHSTALPKPAARAIGGLDDAAIAMLGIAELLFAQDMARDTNPADLLPGHIEGALHCAARMLSSAIVTRLEELQALYPVLHQAQQDAPQAPPQPPPPKEPVAPTIRRQASAVARKLVGRFGSVAAAARAMEMNRHTLGKVIHVDPRIAEDTCRAVCVVARKLGVAVEGEAA